MRKTFAILNSDGDIEKAVNLNETQPLTDENWTEITEDELEVEVNNFPRKFKVKEKIIDGKPKSIAERKPEIQVTVDKAVLDTDKTDKIVVNLAGIPKGMKNVKVAVRDQIITIDEGEPIEVTTDTEGTINIRVVDHRLYSNTKRVVAKRQARQAP